MIRLLYPMCQMRLPNNLCLLFLLFTCGTTVCWCGGDAEAQSFRVLRAQDFRHHIEFFNRMAPEEVATDIPDAQAWDWLQANVPFFTCPDPDVERTYFYRCWAFRKHITRTPKGHVLTEFLRPVKHATDFNAISCALGHHLAEGRWLRNREYLDQYLQFWLRSGEGGSLQRHLHQYSGWVAAAAYERWLADGNKEFLLSLLDAFILDYTTWEKERLLPNGLFWQYDVRDGMEESASGSRIARNARPTINSYMYGNAAAIAKIGAMAGKDANARAFSAKAARLRSLVETQLWDREAGFFKPLLETGKLAEVREQIGFTPWYFHLPEIGRGYEAAWKQLMDPQGFYAPYGPTTVEQRDPGFKVTETGDDCQWNGPSWPFATTVTLKALANVLNDYPQDAVSRDDYFRIFQIYTRSQRLRLPEGREIPWIDENLNPYSGVWQARSMKIRKGKFDGRGDHYNHSAYADLVITGVVGLRPRADDIVEISPLLPANAWDWFCLDGIPYHARTLTVLWDRSGRKFGRGIGLRVFVDGQEITHATSLVRITGRIPPKALASREKGAEKYQDDRKSRKSTRFQ
jgi:hypothetical protein